MNTIELYRLALEGRAYGTIGCGFGFLTLILVAIAVTASCVAVQLKDVLSGKIATYSFIAAILSLAAAVYFNFQANSRPKIDDMKVIIPVKLGEDIINSPQVKEAIDKAINLIPDKNS